MSTAATSIFEPGAVRTLDRISSANLGADLTVCQISYGRVATEDVLEGRAGAEAIYASQDGRSFLMEWAREADDSGDAVYVEILRKSGSDFHGWVDAISRKIVQTG
jgi:hypothetical protein